MGFRVDALGVSDMGQFLTFLRVNFVIYTKKTILTSGAIMSTECKNMYKSGTLGGSVG